MRKSDTTTSTNPDVYLCGHPAVTGLVTGLHWADRDRKLSRTRGAYVCPRNGSGAMPLLSRPDISPDVRRAKPQAQSAGVRA
jgi:hypothetical protein